MINLLHRDLDLVDVLTMFLPVIMRLHTFLTTRTDKF